MTNTSTLISISTHFRFHRRSDHEYSAVGLAPGIRSVGECTGISGLPRARWTKSNRSMLSLLLAARQIRGLGRCRFEQKTMAS